MVGGLASRLSFKEIKVAPKFVNYYLSSHQQTDCFVVSRQFSVARYARYYKPQSKPRVTGGTFYVYLFKNILCRLPEMLMKRYTAFQLSHIYIYIYIVVGNGHGDTSSNTGRD